MVIHAEEQREKGTLGRFEEGILPVSKGMAGSERLLKI